MAIYRICSAAVCFISRCDYVILLELVKSETEVLLSVLASVFEFLCLFCMLASELLGEGRALSVDYAGAQLVGREYEGNSYNEYCWCC